MKKIWVIFGVAIILAAAGYYYFVARNNNAGLDTNFAQHTDKANNNISSANTNAAKIPKMSFTVTPGEQCYISKSNFTTFTIYKDSKSVASIQGQHCEIALDFIATDSLGSYFSILPDGIGGYILYGKYFNLYHLDFANNKITEIKLNDPNRLVDIAFTSDLSKLVYEKESDSQSANRFVVVRNLKTGSEESFPFPTTTVRPQIGDFKFSPDQTKVAIAAGYGPDNEHGEIYILDLRTKKIVLYKQTPAPPQISGWLNNNDIEWK